MVLSMAGRVDVLTGKVSPTRASRSGRDNCVETLNLGGCAGGLAAGSAPGLGRLRAFPGVSGSGKSTKSGVLRCPLK